MTDCSIVKQAAERAFGVSFVSFDRVHCGNSSVNFRAALPDGTRYFVKVAKPAAVRCVIERTSAVKSPLVPHVAFGGATAEIGGRLLCAFEWVPSGESVPPWALTEAQVRGIVEGYRALSAAFGGMVHGDFHYKNYFLQGDVLSACFDLEKMRPGLPTEDLLRIFVHALERTRFWRFRRIAAVERNFALMVRIAGYSREDWLAAIDRYERHKIERRRAKARFAPVAAFEARLRSRLYSRLRSLVIKYV